MSGIFFWIGAVCYVREVNESLWVRSPECPWVSPNNEKKETEIKTEILISHWKNYLLRQSDKCTFFFSSGNRIWWLPPNSSINCYSAEILVTGKCEQGMDLGVKWTSLVAQLIPGDHIQKSHHFLIVPDIFEGNEGTRVV